MRIRQLADHFRLKPLAGILAAGGIGLAAAQSGVHPGFTFTSLRPAGFNPMVSGLDLLPDGTLAISTWEGFGTTKGSVFLLPDARNASTSSPMPKTFASGFNEPLGVKSVSGTLHIITRDKLLALPDANQDGVADAPRTLASGWGALNSDPKILEFAFGLPIREGKFYMGLATAWPVGTAQAKERGCILEVDATTGAHTPYACGMRTPNGMALGPEDELFVTENQGNWVPASKLINVKKGKFYGVRKEHPTGFPNGMTETPPALWLPHGDVSISPTQPVWLKSGRFKGQMVAGDNNMGTLHRYFLEKVGGEWQGAVLRFTAGLEAGANRIVAGPDGALYVGGIGTNLWGGWAWNSKWYGLQRLTETSGSAFEFLAVRSKGENTFEVEFTEPAAAGAATAANWTVRQWNYIPVEAYGQGKQPNQNLTVSSATLTPDGRKVTLEIPGLKVRHVVHLRLANVMSREGKSLWSGDAWYTLNAFGPGTDPVVEPVSVRKASERRVSLGMRGAFPIGLEGRDISGRVRRIR
jgi:hypothetical protein